MGVDGALRAPARARKPQSRVGGTELAADPGGARRAGGRGRRGVRAAAASVVVFAVVVVAYIVLRVGEPQTGGFL